MFAESEPSDFEGFAESEPSDREAFAESDEVFADSHETESSEHFAQSESSDTDSKTPLNPCPLLEHSVKFEPLPCKLYERRMVSQGETLNINQVENICSKACKNGCAEFVSKMQNDVKAEMVMLFRGDSKTDSKNKMMMHLRSQNVMGLDAESFTFKSHTFCLTAFCKVTGLSKYLAVKVIKDLTRGFNQYIHGSKGSFKSSVAQVNFISWMICFSELHGQSDPVTVTTILPAFLSKAELYKIYKAEASGPHLKPSTFYHSMKNQFGCKRKDRSLPNIRIRETTNKTHIYNI